MRIMTVKEINERLEFNAEQFISERENDYNSRIAEIALSLHDHTADSPIVLLSGPSGSGKTTSSVRIEECLDKMGSETHSIAMDDYFLTCDKNEKAKDENGVIDYESPYRVNIELLSEHLEKIANCEPVELPHFNFQTQESEMSGKILHRKPGELVIMEGIHALNPLVTGKSSEYSCGIYVSVRTRLQTSDGNLLHPSKIRLMRRLIRDRLYRARSFEDSLKRYKSVEDGVNNFILPFKKNAQFEIDSFMGYEVPAFKDVLCEDIAKLIATYKDFEQFSDIAKVLCESVGIQSGLIPQNSLLREFVGTVD